MKIIVTFLYIIIVILSIIVFKENGIGIGVILLPLLIIYYRANSISQRIKKKKVENGKINLLERKEVEFVSSRDRKKGVSKGPRKKEVQKVSKNKKSDKKTNSRRKENDKKKKKKGIWKKLITIFLSLMLVGISAVVCFMIYIVATAGKFDPNALLNQDQTIIYDSGGQVIATLGAEKRESISYDDLPQVLIDAIVATEDSRFYQHNGVDMARFLKASILQIFGHGDAGGASTLTMQVVKNNITDNSRSIIRKFKDVYISMFFLEKKYTKEEILEFYINDSCLGGTIFGVEEASKYYFGKSASQLTLPEASLLAGMYQAPSRYNPYKSPEAATARRNTVLSLMVRHGYITKEEAEMAKAVSVESMLSGSAKESPYQGYIDTVIEEVKEKTGDNPALVSMKIYTALDRNIQDGINKVLSGKDDHKWADDYVQAGIAVTNVNDGTIVAIGAGRNRDSGNWNYATQSRRQPGSTAKPVFDYGPGFEYNDFSTYTLFNDEKWSYTNGPEVGNWDSSYEGLITLRRALSYSRNVPALKAFQMVDKKNIVSFVNGLGLDIALSTKSDNYKKYENGADNVLNEAYSIGGLSYGVTPLEMAEAYACFANGGYHIDTHAVTKIEYRSTGEVKEFEAKKEKVMSDSTAYLMNNVLQYAVEAGFNGGARVYGSTVAAKTGTSNLPTETIKKYGLPYGAVNDLWTVAYTPEYAISLWYGYEKVDSSHYLSGASAPKDSVMRNVMKYIPKTSKKWEMPSSVVAVTVEKETWPAQLPSEFTPNDMKITEYFKKGTQPTEVSQRYAKLDNVTNIQSKKTNEGYKITWNWKTPNILDSAYLSKYFSNSVFGNGSANFLEKRIKYNDEVLGGNGFGIYVKDATGTLTRIAFTKDMEYVYVPDKKGNVQIVVKAEYGKFNSNASDGTSITINADGPMVVEPEVPTEDILLVKLKDSMSVTVVKGKYTEKGLTVTFDGKDVTNNADISYQVDTAMFSSQSELENKVNSLEPGSYKILYTVKYKGNTEKLERNVTIISE